MCLQSMIHNVKGHGARCMKFITVAKNTEKNPIGKIVTAEIHISEYTCQKLISLLFTYNTCQQWVENYQVSDFVFTISFTKPSMQVTIGKYCTYYPLEYNIH